MAFLTAYQVGQYALQAGIPKSSLATMIAIADAESSFNTTAIGDTTLENAEWGPSVGLWQIRSVKAEYGTGQDRDSSRLTDPLFNAQAAYQISSGGVNFGAWTTYTSGKYLQYMTTAQAAASQLVGSSSQPSIPTQIEHSVTKHPFIYLAGASLVALAGVYAYRTLGKSS